MPTFHITSPDGGTFEINAPEGASESDVLAYAQKNMHAAAPAAKAPNPTDGQGFFSNMAAGIGKGMTDLALGAKQRLNDAAGSPIAMAAMGPMGGLATWLTNRALQGSSSSDQYSQDLTAQAQEKRKLDAPLAATGGGKTGDIAAKLIPALLASAIPGGQGLLGSMAIGAGSGALEPSVSNQETAKNAAFGGVGGAAGYGLAKGIGLGYNTLKSLVQPFYSGGQNAIVGKGLLDAAGSPADAETAVKSLLASKELVPGSAPTVGQASGNASLAALERTASQTNPTVMNAFSNRMEAQNAARIAALEDMAGTDSSRQALVNKVESSAKDLYGKAFQESVPVTPELQALVNRPSMKMAEGRAKSLSDELSAPFQATLADMRPKTVPVDAPERISSFFGKRVGEGAPAPEIQISSGPASTTMQIPPVDSVPVRDMHTIKMAMDAMMKDPTLGIAGREGAAINATRNRMLDMLPESYQIARQAHIDLNKPVNQMDIVQEILNKALNQSRGTLKPEQFAKSLSDSTAQSATGLRTATLEGMMDPAQMATLNAIKNDLSNNIFAQTAGKGSGSDSIQKLAYSNMLGKSGIPNMIQNWGPAQTIGNLFSRGADALYGGANKKLAENLAMSLMDPKTSAQLMQKALEDASPSTLGLLGTMLSGRVGSLAPSLLNLSQQ